MIEILNYRLRGLQCSFFREGLSTSLEAVVSGVSSIRDAKASDPIDSATAKGAAFWKSFLSDLQAFSLTFWLVEWHFLFLLCHNGRQLRQQVEH